MQGLATGSAAGAQSPRIKDRSGEDQYPTSILDFVFLGQDAKDWNASSQIIVRDGDFPDDERRSDHRPVMAVVQP